MLCAKIIEIGVKFVKVNTD